MKKPVDEKVLRPLEILMSIVAVLTMAGSILAITVEAYSYALMCAAVLATVIVIVCKANLSDWR